MILFLQHVAGRAVGPPRLVSSAETRVPTSIGHLPPVGGERGVRHRIRPWVIQTGGCLGSAVGMSEEGIQMGTGVLEMVEQAI